ncbi:RNA recognition motif domain-containing protein [Parasediminibacterium sp. JCM 36343]|uniref:RNA recognition motif domain-containing protein n=1 Tax=Parasediminibacterium sp. JCM 36343 TaxID=3374279 RepID=UPI00397D19CA
MKLFVGGISGNLDEVDLKEMFELYGDVVSAIIIKDRETGKSKGFGFVDMANSAEAKEAIDLLDGVSLFGKKIAVKAAEEQPRTGAPRTGFVNKSAPPRRRF